MVVSEIKAIFVHPVMVDRVAAMFNDFLLKLVSLCVVSDLARSESASHDLEQTHVHGSSPLPLAIRLS